MPKLQKLFQKRAWKKHSCSKNTQTQTHQKQCPKFGSLKRLCFLKRSTYPLVFKGKTEPFKMEDLETVLNVIQTNKSRDPGGISRIIFKNSIVGTNLKDSLLLFLIN